MNLSVHFLGDVSSERNFVGYFAGDITDSRAISVGTLDFLVFARLRIHDVSPMSVTFIPNIVNI